MKSRFAEIRRARPLLGTYVEVAVEGMSEQAAHCAIAAAFEAIAEVQSRMSFHDPGSTLSFVNRNAGHTWVPLDESTFAVLQFAARLYRLSAGIFDVTLSLRHQHSGSFSDVELDPKKSVRFRNPDIRIDLGGIAKGFAVDRAVTVLKECGVPAGLVNAGGDLRVFGEKRFPVAIRHPHDPGHSLLTFSVTNAALATSAHYFSADPRAGEIVDGGRRRLARSIASATVRAREAMTADALTKVAIISGEQASAALQHFGAEAILVSSAGDAQCSSNWHATLDLSA